MKLFCKDRYFVDEYGRVRLFGGINYVDKGLVPDENGVVRFHFNISEEGLRALAAKGMNIVRLGVTWAGISPNPDEINYTYLDDVKAAIKRLNSCGFEVYLDFHQDLFSSFICSAGDGAPRYACKMSENAKSKKPYVIWAEDYFLNPRVHGSFDNFWTPGSFTQQQFLLTLKKTAEYLSDCDITAYDVLNEPFPGSPAKKVAAAIVTSAIKTLGFSKRVDRKKLLRDAKSGDVFKLLEVIDDEKVYNSVIKSSAKIIKKFDEERYVPFLKKAEQTLREAGFDGIVFAENCYFSNLGIPCNIEKISDKMAFAPHGYDITVDTPLTNTASPYRIDFIFNEHRRTQDRINVPVLVGEWGGMVDGADDYPALRHLVKKFDTNYWSYTYWHWFEGFENTLIADTMCRFYPVAVAGTPTGFDNTPGRFVLAYQGDETCEKDTEIFLAKPPVKVYSTHPYEIKGDRLFVKPGSGKSVVIAEY